MNSKILLVLFAMVLVIVSCEKKTDDNYERISISSASLLADSQLSPAEKSEGLAKQAETLLTAQGFLEAKEVVQLSLKQDSSNLRAQFINALLGPLMLQQGFFTRYMSVAKRDPLLLNEYLELIKGRLQLPESALKKFLTDGVPVFSNEEQVQKHIDLVYEAFDRLRIFSKEIKDNELSIKSNLDLTPDLIRRYAQACEIVTTAKFEYELKCPPSEKRYDVNLNRADFESIEYISACYQVYFALLNGYDLSSSVATKGSYRKKVNPPAADILRDLLKDSKFGKLRSTHHLAKVKELGLEMITGMRWAMARQSSLCPIGEANPKNRFGMLINYGICLPPVMEPFLAEFEKSFLGQPLDFVSSKEGKTHTTKIVHLAVLDNPYFDLRTLMPVKFDACGAIQSVADPKINGTYPNGDANIVIPLRNPVCSK